MAGINFVRRWVMGQMTKKADDGIMITLPDSSKVDLNVSITMDRLIRNGIDPDQITSPQQVENALNMIDSRMVSRSIPADSTEGREITEKIFGKQKAPVFDLEGNRIPEGSGIMGGKAVKDLMDSGQVSKGARGMKKSKKVEDREMFQAANERLTSDVNSIIKNIKSMEPITAMKEANSVIGRKGKYKNLTPEQSKKILQDTEDHIFERNIPEDPEDFASGGIARANFVGGGMGRRGFLKMLAGLGGGIAAAKTGLLKFAGKEPVKQVAKEVVQKSTTTPPPYFFKLVDKIKKLGDDVTEKAATKDREVVTKYKDIELTEDVATGEKTIQRIKTDTDAMYYDETLAEDVYMNYKPGKGQADETTGKVMDEYVEDTSYIRTTGPQKGDIYDTVDGIPEDLLEEAGEKIIEKKIKSSPLNKASGGIARLGYQVGGDVSYDATDPIYGSSAATFTPDTVMDQFGNQVQAEMGNNFNKPLIPQVTDQAANKSPSRSSGGITDIPAAGGMGGLGETDLPVAGGNNNEMGILPVLPQDGSPKDARFRDPGPGIGTGGKLEAVKYNDPLPQDQLMSGFKEYVRNNPYSGAGTTAIKKAILPGGYEYTFSGSQEANKFNEYLASIGQAPYQAQQDPTMLVKFASGGIARMLGE